MVDFALGTAYMGFEPEIESAVKKFRAQKIVEKKSAKPKDRRRLRRKPRFCITTVVRLCPRQREARKRLEEK